MGPQDVAVGQSLAGQVAGADGEKARDAHLRRHVEQIPAITYMEYTDAGNHLGYSDIYVSPQIEAILGYPPAWWLDDLSGMAWNSIMHPDDVDRVEAEARRTAIERCPYAIEYRVRHAEGRWVWIRDEAFLAQSEGGRPYWHGVMIDITERKQMEEQLSKAEARFRSLVEQIPAILYVEPIGTSSEERYVSPHVIEMLGCSPAAWLDNEEWLVEHALAEQHDLVREHRALTLAGHPIASEFAVLRDDGATVWVRDEPRLIVRPDGSPWLIQGLMHDVTERHLANQEIEFLAYHDRLTGLANRALFEAMLDASLARARRHHAALAVLFLDLDGFKPVNDRYGHHVGDLLLVEVAERLTAAVRDADLVARQGGDEFLVLLPDLDDGRAVADEVAERISAAVLEPFLIDAAEIRIAVSIGLGLFPDSASDAASLLRSADAAMYEEKLGKAARVAS